MSRTTSVQDSASIHTGQSAGDGYVVVSLVGDLDAAAAPEVHRALLQCLAEQPDAVICDLSGVQRIDPVCATILTAVAHPPASRWPDSSLVLCSARPAVAAVLLQHGTRRALPIYDTLEQALAHARSRPPFLRERLRLVATLNAISAARWFVGEVCKRWQLDELTETAQLLVGEMTTDTVLHKPTGVAAIELRLEVRATELVIAVQTTDPLRAPAEAYQDGGPESGLAEADQDGGPRSGLQLVRQVAKNWGVRRQPDGSRVVWCVVRHPA